MWGRWKKLSSTSPISLPSSSPPFCVSKVTRFLSDEHFSVDGTLVEAWASLEVPRQGQFREPPHQAHGERDFHDEKRSNETHASTTDADARLYRKGSSQAAYLSYMDML